MRLLRLGILVLIGGAGAIAGAILDTPLRHLVQPPGVPAAYLDRVDSLAMFPPEGAVAFIGDSHVERGVWRGLLPGMDVANFGISGDSTEGVLARLSTVASEQIVVLVGVNDIAAGSDPEEVAKSIEEIVARLGPARTTLLTVMPVRGRYAGHNAAIRRLNALLPQACMSPCRLVDTWSRLAERGELSEPFSRDGLHLNATGYAALATSIREALVPQPIARPSPPPSE